MINTLYGILFMVDPVGCSVVIECAGVGYKVQVSAGTLAKLPSPVIIRTVHLWNLRKKYGCSHIWPSEKTLWSCTALPRRKNWICSSC